MAHDIQVPEPIPVGLAALTADQLAAIPTDDLLEVRQDIALKMGDLARQAAAIRADHLLLEAEFYRRAKAKGGRVLPHSDWRIEVVVEKGKKQKNEQALLELKRLVKLSENPDGFLTPEEVAEVVREVPKTEIKSDIRKAEKLAEKYGGEVRQIVERAVWREPDTERLVVEPKCQALGTDSG